MNLLEKKYLLYQFLLYFLQFKSFPPWMACFIQILMTKHCWCPTSFDNLILKLFWKPNPWMNLLEKNFLLYQFLLYFLQLKSFPPWMACFNSNINDSEVVLLTKFDGRTYFVKSQSSLLNFCHLTSFLFHHHHFNGNFGKTVFSVKSSREVHWIIMFQKDSVWPRAPVTAGAVRTQTGQFISNFRWLVSSFFGTCFESLRICRSNPLFHDC